MSHQIRALYSGLCALGLSAFGLAHADPVPGGATINCNQAGTCAFAPQTSTLTQLNLSAEGVVKAAPDMAMITFGVLNQAKNAKSAMAANSERMNAVFAALKAQGITEKNIQTTGISLNAQYAYPANHGPVLKGYQASNQVSVRVEDLKNLGGSIDAVIAAGINQVDGISFGLKDPSKSQDEARRQAVATLMGRARLYADSLGLKIKRVANVTEGGGYQPQPMNMPMARMSMAAEAAPTPVAPGEMSINMTISATFDLEK